MRGTRIRLRHRHDARRWRRALGGAALSAALVAAWSANAFAQLDPLLFMKRVPPTVIVVVDTSREMLEDGNGYYYDPVFYRAADDPTVATALGVTSVTYRRKFKNLAFESTIDISTKYSADDIQAVGMLWDPSNALTSNAPADLAFMDNTRYRMATKGIAQAVTENDRWSYRWGLLKLRQNGAAWRTSPNCDAPVRITNNLTLEAVNDTSPCMVGGSGRFGIYAPSVIGPSYAVTTAPGDAVKVVPGANTWAAMLDVLNRPVPDPAALIPASGGAQGYTDRPISYALDDARSQAVAVMAADSAAFRARRNTVVVLVTSGADDGDASYKAAHDPTAIASTFSSVSGGGVTKRVPIVVVAIKPKAADEAQLQQIATNSGGYYFNVSSAAEVTRAVNFAVQAGFSRAADFDVSQPTEFAPVSPVVGTVDLKNANSATGAALPNTDIVSSPGGQPVPQRSNLMLTGGFALPSFDGRLRAFRTYKPVADATQPSGWTFNGDGTPLWPDLDGRSQLAGIARTPIDPDRRNIYTFIPDGSGGGSVVALTVANAALIQPHLAGADAATLIPFVRQLPIGAVIGSTPAIMDPPSLDPPPDDDYGRSDAAGTFAGDHKDRRAIIFVGTNDGMVHAIDARTGYEVWAFIPYNLLPKLKTLLDGQPVEEFDYFVDSSPKIAELKVDGVWRSFLFIGEGPGGIFYQAFDVTEAGMGVSPDADGIGTVDSLLGLFDTPNETIQFLWSFPNYSSFNPNYYAEFPLTDGSPGNIVKLYGDLKDTATTAEKSVGFTWSDPAVGPLDATRSVNALMVGSGYFPAIEDLIPARGPGAPRAGRSLYLIDVKTGTLLGNPTGGSCNGVGCLDVGDIANSRKNALQADPSAAAESGSYVVTKAYLGDLDGEYWRFNFDDTGNITKNEMVFADQPIYASSALLFVGSSDIYMFFATGSDLLPVTTTGGTGSFRLIGLKDNAPGGGSTTKFVQSLATVTSTGDGYAVGERPSTSPSVAGDIVFYTTTVQDANGVVTSNLYALTYLGGAAYDSTGDGQISSNESPIVRTVAGRASAPFIVDQHLYIASSGESGANVDILGDPADFNNGVGQVGVRILSWREIR